jgi:hypothetical protein
MKGYTFGNISNEKVFEYILLEYPFSFYQNCSDCFNIPAITDPIKDIVQHVVNVVSPRFYSSSFRSKLEPSFYMFYHELGYYEYDLKPFKQWLTYNEYPNSVFVPAKADIQFDPAYLTSINKFINDPATKGLIFIYGERDPYSSTAPTFNNNSSCLVLIGKNSCHKASVEDLSKEQQRVVFDELSKLLEVPVGR